MLDFGTGHAGFTEVMLGLAGIMLGFEKGYAGFWQGSVWVQQRLCWVGQGSCWVWQGSRQVWQELCLLDRGHAGGLAGVMLGVPEVMLGCAITKVPALALAWQPKSARHRSIVGVIELSRKEEDGCGVRIVNCIW